jgi:hypothetical protein
VLELENIDKSWELERSLCFLDRKRVFGKMLLKFEIMKKVCTADSRFYPKFFFVPTIDKPLKYLSILSENFLVPSIGQNRESTVFSIF